MKYQKLIKRSNSIFLSEFRGSGEEVPISKG